MKSQLKRRRGVDCFDLNDKLIRGFDTVREAEIFFELSKGCIHTLIKRAGGKAKIKNHFFKFQDS